MRIWPVSDIHLRQEDALHLRKSFNIPDADVCLCAGDVTRGFAQALHWLGNVVAPKMPVVLTFGNHDYFGTSIDRAISEARRIAKALNIKLLENDTEIIDGVRFVGATLWTDYKLSVGGAYARKSAEEFEASFFHVLPRELVDFAEIHRSDERREGETGFITVQEIKQRHSVSRAYIENVLATPFDGPSVVMSHHAPLPACIHPRFEGDLLNPAFASDLSGIMTQYAPAAWVHGHVHHFIDLMEGQTRVICNAKGQGNYPSNFQWDFTFEV